MINKKVVDALRELADKIENKELSNEEYIIYYLARIGMMIDKDAVRIIGKK